MLIIRFFFPSDKHKRRKDEGAGCGTHGAGSSCHWHSSEADRRDSRAAYSSSSGRLSAWMMHSEPLERNKKDRKTKWGVVTSNLAVYDIVQDECKTRWQHCDHQLLTFWINKINRTKTWKMYKSKGSNFLCPKLLGQNHTNPLNVQLVRVIIQTKDKRTISITWHLSRARDCHLPTGLEAHFQISSWAD